MANPETSHLESFTSFYEKEDPMDALLIERELEIIRKTCTPAGKTALEVGCGNGLATIGLSAIFPELEVVEAAAGNIELLRRRLPGIPCHQTLLEDFKPDRKFDHIFFLNVIEHVEDPVASLRHLAGLLRDEGRVFISAPNCMSLNRRAGYLMGLLDSYDQFAPKDYEVGHRRLYTTRMLEDHCTQAGLRILDLKGLYLKPLSEKQMLALGDAAIRAFHQLGEDVPEYCACLLAIATKAHY
jgi:2-polyprenyl-3-methyl-5-hydroxy-6-metoxy-1,4-benzoquinol methylase